MCLTDTSKGERWQKALFQVGSSFNISDALEYQQNGEDVEQEALEAEAVFCAVGEHLFGRVFACHPKQGLGVRDSPVGKFPDELTVVEPRRSSVRAVEGDKGLPVGGICRSGKSGAHIRHNRG